MSDVLKHTFLPELGKRRQGKVRDIYEHGNTITLIASDRISVFDRVLNEAIPDKGRLLTQLSLFWFEQTQDIIANHIVGHPDPNVMVVKKCKPLPVEMIVRGYLTGSVWRDYQSGKRHKSGIPLPEGMQQNQAFPAPIVTPTTKADVGQHDEDISKEELIKTGIVTKELWEQLEKVSLELYKRGQELLDKKGLILVDTKYEFGIDEEGSLVLIDEIHTPDSSRFWFKKDMGMKEVKFPDKEFAREYCRSQGFIGEGKLPTLPPEIVSKVRAGYNEVYETITGESLAHYPFSVSTRLLGHLKKANMIKGSFVLLLSGSEKDQHHMEKITAVLAEHGIPHKAIIASAHKTPKQVLDLIDEYNQSLEPIVCITSAGRSNALSGMVAANLKWPVIACPPFKDHSDYAVNIHSSLQMPSNVPALTVVDPGNAALAAIRILKNHGALCMKVLVIGSGGREHALVHTFHQQGHEVQCIPGNAGTRLMCPPLDSPWEFLDDKDIPALVEYAKATQVELAVIGPEALLEQGIADIFAREGIPLFGPNQQSCRLESSKAWSKTFMHKYGIATARFVICNDSVEALGQAEIRFHEWGGLVIKASGLCAGKGVVVCRSLEEAVRAIKTIMIDKIYGAAGNMVVIEELLQGPEVSIIALTDGTTAIPMVPAQDHKRLYDGGQGPNTGGIGAYAPTPFLQPDMLNGIADSFLKRTLEGLKQEGLHYAGFLYLGLMLTAKGPYLLEYNCRMGDPEAQVILPLLDSDLAKTMLACCKRELGNESVQWKSASSCCIVMVSRGYPQTFPVGFPISGIDAAEKEEGVIVFHAGTTFDKEGRIVTAGGRVVGVTALAGSLEKAIEKAYTAADKIKFEGAYYRHDIGSQAGHGLAQANA